MTFYNRHLLNKLTFRRILHGTNFHQQDGIFIKTQRS